MDKKVLWKITVISGALQWFFLGAVYVLRKTTVQLFSDIMVSDSNAPAEWESTSRSVIDSIPFYPITLILGLITLVFSILFLSKWKENRTRQNLSALLLNLPFILIVIFLLLLSRLFHSWSGASLGST